MQSVVWSPGSSSSLAKNHALHSRNANYVVSYGKNLRSLNNLSFRAFQIYHISQGKPLTNSSIFPPLIDFERR